MSRCYLDADIDNGRNKSRKGDERMSSLPAEQPAMQIFAGAYPSSTKYRYASRLSSILRRRHKVGTIQIPERPRTGRQNVNHAPQRLLRVHTPKQAVPCRRCTFQKYADEPQGKP